MTFFKLKTVKSIRGRGRSLRSDPNAGELKTLPQTSYSWISGGCLAAEGGYRAGKRGRRQYIAGWVGRELEKEEGKRG